MATNSIQVPSADARPAALRTMAGLSSLFLAQVVAAQAIPTITDADIERAKKLQPVITEQDIARAMHTHSMPQDPPPGPTSTTPRMRIDALPQPRPTPPVDLGAMAKGYEAASNPIALAALNGDRLLVFVTFAMPEAALHKLAMQAAQLQATLLLRGLDDGSLVKTVVHVQKIMGERKVAWQIDPQAFDRFAVRQAPTFVLLSAGAPTQACGAGSCFAPDAYVRVAGDVSLDYALKTIQQRAPRFADSAGRFLDKIGK
ncbi:type-F conjugative transfer system pilin assembly protein TrbC [Janthinobacterium rivuli]|uniref:type-F conjugative transfer system pilin assembly protein TrbC n=1 Tax=Janthinobacterium sp. FT68W TaxID=2654255 RepID=UPI0012642C4B|nr:type-F conjugative transfer system pilin assembly protein TrbC [Janthinobacterium sp. FT68W]KAB8049555.1 type-F conjugative transfer system pilin assembly protein TrbC [Janthinobacterium sp. FT68W]